MKIGTPYRYARNLLKPLVDDVSIRRKRRKYRANAHPGRLDADWKATNYNRVSTVNILCSDHVDPSYLEIGCFNNDLFDAVTAKKKIGVDPVSGGTIRATSDDFFKTNQEKFDVVFVDGLHEYEQVRRDVINSLNCLNPGGWIAIHDMIPGNWLEEHTPVINGAWTGDVWKLGFELAEASGIDFMILKIDHGVGVIKLTDANPSVPDRRNELRDHRFSYLYDHSSKLPLMDWSEGRLWMEARFTRR